MKVLLAAAVVAGLLALSGCGTAASTTPASSAAATAPTTQAAQSTSSLDGKAHFTGDYAMTTAADSAAIIEIARQWSTPEEKDALKAKMDAAGLSSSIPAEIAPTWYSRAAVSCQAKFDGHPMPVDGVYAQINTLILDTYCPELG